MFSGSIVALITPFCKGEVDHETLQGLVDWHVQHGTQGIVACGSTGEGALLNFSERNKVIRKAVDQAQGRIPVIAGCGSPSTREALEMLHYAKDLGCSAVLVVTPYYVKPTPEGVYQHFKELNSVGIPIIIYNNPGRAVVELSVDLVVRLSELTNVVGIKDSCDDLTRVIKMRQRIMRPFSFLSGDDPIATAYLAHGGDGVISVSANVVPSLCQQVVEAWKKRDLDTFETLRDALLPLHEALGMEPNPCPIKYAMSTLGLCRNELRLPLIPVQDKTKETIVRALSSLSTLSGYEILPQYFASLRGAM